MIFVAGKGGTGRSTVAAALAMLGVRAGKRVLAIDVDAKGDLSSALGSPPAGFAPQIVQHNLSVLALHTDESFQEYLSIYFKVPRIARLTPLARVFDFIATGVPGPRDMLVVGKIAYEERRREPNSRPVWDLIVVDCAAGGQVESHLAAARAMLTLVRGGIIRTQVEWIDSLVRDPARSTVVLCSLPQEMPVTEAIELYDRLRASSGVAVDLCVLNRAVATAVTAAQQRLVATLCDPEHEEAVHARLQGSPEPIRVALELSAQLHESTARHLRQLRSRLPIPVISVPLTAARSGLATTRAVADSIGGALQ